MKAALGIEFGSTRIKACLVDAEDARTVLATGSHAWENRLESGIWTYDLDAVWTGVREAVAELLDQSRSASGGVPEIVAIGISAMMHGYLAFDDRGTLLVPFRTWRNTHTGTAADELSQTFGMNIPLRWSIAHLHQAIRDGEEHVSEIASITTLAGYVHRRLTGAHVLGVGDASGMFPIGAGSTAYDSDLLARYRRLVPQIDLLELLPEPLPAGADAGYLTVDGAALLDPAGAIPAGVPLCPPEGDAGAGMVATGAVAPRTGNVSAGTSIFAMVVLESPLSAAHGELDLVTTPAGDPVAMVHCNNGASELAAWAGLFERFAAATGTPLSADAVFDTLFAEALDGAPDAGGLLAYNHLAGEPIAGLEAGRPLFVRTPDSDFRLGNVMRAQIYGVYGTLALGMRVLEHEGVGIDRMLAHGGLFRTAGVAQRLLAAALDAPVAVGETAAEGGAWGMAVLAAFRLRAGEGGLSEYLDESVFAGVAADIAHPHPDDVAGFARYLDRYAAGLAVEAAAVDALPVSARSSKDPS